MPLFNRKFDLKPLPARMARGNSGCPLIIEDLNDYKEITLKLHNNRWSFIEGQWRQWNKNINHDILGTNRQIKNLEVKKNMSDLKVEILLDLLTENVIELTTAK